LTKRSHRGAPLVVAALVLAALSLVRPWALAFDPWAWLVWGRETGRLALDTSSGPSWKPFPVLLTTPLALLGDAAPALWLVVARAGGLLALAGAFALALRLGGRWAGVAAAAVMALSPWWLFNTALGNSEGLLAAAVLWAVVAHLADRPRAALVLLTVAGLMRPEVWPFLGAYGLWLWRRERGWVIAAGAATLLLWFGPDVLGAGGALDASSAGRGIPSPGSAKLADVPVLALLSDTVTLFTIPAVIAAIFATGADARRIAAGAAAWVAIVAVMTVAGYAGNPRYLVAAAALGAVLAGVGAVRATTALTDSPFAAPLGAAVLVAAVLATTLGELRDQTRELGDRAAAGGAFDGVLAAAGGAQALLDCSRIRTSNRGRTLVAWELDLPLRDLDATPVKPAVVIRTKWFYGDGLEPPVGPGYETLAVAPAWQIVAACGRAPQIEDP
jgi:hypothetical protein